MAQARDRDSFESRSARRSKQWPSIAILVVAVVGAGLIACDSTSKDGDSRIEVAAETAEVSTTEASSMETPATEAAAAIASLRKGLGGALRNGLAKGPVEAISACRLDAPRITGEIGEGRMMTVGRTSHRLRNPDNAPEDWMRPLLDEYRHVEPSPGSSRTVDLGDRGMGYVEPIYLKPLCATCHGENVDPKLLASIREQYPDDEAVGFRVGEFRGLFWAVTKESPVH